MKDDMMKCLLKERPVGSDNNTAILIYLETALTGMGYDIKRLPFSCTTWQTKDSCLFLNGRSIQIYASPFSLSYNGTAKLVFVKSKAELEAADCQDRVVIIGGEMAATPLQPKDYPFYYPDEQRQLIELLESKQPAAIIAATGKAVLCGLSPFPLFEDGNFLIPSAYMPQAVFEELRYNYNEAVAKVSIQSDNLIRNSYQIVAQKETRCSRGKIVICAHMDTKYHTLGALDNGMGVAVLLEAAAKLANSDCDIDIVPFNGEEYYEATGEVEYLKYTQAEQDKISMLINIDSPCHIGSKIAVSLYNFNDSAKEAFDLFMKTQKDIVCGPEWYAGDHAAFAFMGIPCMVLTSSDLFEGGLNHTHTMRDTLDTVDLAQVDVAAQYIHNFITEIPI